LRILAIDYGTKRIGVAIADTQVHLAFAREPLLSRGEVEDSKAINDLFREERCDLVLVGLPILESGEEGEQSTLTRSFAARLMDLCVPVQLRDERYTTSAARANLAHVKPSERKSLLDSEAARLLLAEYLASLDT
jgi:putative Holliday junction resolvase